MLARQTPTGTSSSPPFPPANAALRGESLNGSCGVTSHEAESTMLVPQSECQPRPASQPLPRTPPSHHRTTSTPSSGILPSLALPQVPPSSECQSRCRRLFHELGSARSPYKAKYRLTRAPPLLLPSSLNQSKL
ncbi:hypothetical protein E2C01_070183 [Portunus trituberculatus]|uniref:Uncharacterized protein n=1 Tax=Portunus trituberculatus TaxID=210409 RepID=A0A5B7I2U7_PORTR|nr:hypothetical protein [Portunus trituberculatus]